MQYSTTQASNILAAASVIVVIARMFKLNVAQSDVESLLGAGFALFAIVMNFVHRYKKGDLTMGGFKK